MAKFFIYGSLKQGHHNFYRFMSHFDGVKYIGNTKTLPRWSLYVIADQFPALVRTGKRKIEGEIWEIPDRYIRHFDSFECGYKKVKIITEDGTFLTYTKTPEQVRMCPKLKLSYWPVFNTKNKPIRKPTKTCLSWHNMPEKIINQYQEENYA